LIRWHVRQCGNSPCSCSASPFASASPPRSLPSSFPGDSDVREPVTHTPRTNRRWIDPTHGSDDADGLTKQTAWQSLRGKASQVPPDCEIVFADGTHQLNGYVYKRSAGQILPNGVTIRSETPRGARLVGPTTYPASGAIYPESGLFIFTTDDADDSDQQSDVEIFGLDLVCDARRSATILLQFNNTGFRIVNNRIAPRYPEWHTHGIYLSSGTRYATAVRDVYIADNEIIKLPGQGSGIHSFSGEEEPAGTISGCHDVVIERNRISGAGRWGMAWGATRNGGPMNVLCRDNVIMGSWSDGAVVFASVHLAGAGGVDPTFVLERNWLSNDSGHLIRRYEVEGGDDQHTPTLRHQRYDIPSMSDLPKVSTEPVGDGDRIWSR